MTVKINLMPKKSSEDFDKKDQSSFFYFIALALFIISLLSFSGAFVWQNYFLKEELGKNKSQNDYLSAEISEKLKSPSVAVNKKAKNAGKILANHLYWSKFYNMLETFTLKSVSYKNFSMDAAASKNDVIKANIGGEAGSFRDLAKQLMSFRENKNIVSMEFEKAEVNKNGKIDFSIGLGFKQSLLKYAPLSN